MERVTKHRIPLIQCLKSGTADSQDLMKLVSWPEEDLLSQTSGVCTDSVTLSWLIWALLSSYSYYNVLKRSKDEHSSAGKRNHVVTSIISQKLRLINRLESGDSQRVVMVSYNNRSTIYIYI